MRFRFVFLATAVFWASPVMRAQHKIERLYVFGDSYSDTGRGWGDGNGPTAVFYFAQKMGLRLIASNAPHEVTDSLNFAVSGAQTGEHPGHTVTGGMLGFGMKNQVDEFVQMEKMHGLRFDPATTLFFFAGGLNDKSLETSTTVSNLEGEVRTLYALGARRFEIAILPETIGSFREVALRLNPALRKIPAELRDTLPEATIMMSDWGKYYDDVKRGGAKYGFTETVKPCAAGRYIFQQDATPCATPEAYYFYNGDHPSTKVHRIVGEMMAAAELAKEASGKLP